MSQSLSTYRRPTVDDLLALARQRFQQGRFENIELLAGELGISRATAYKWIGNSDRMLAVLLAEQTEEHFHRACAEARGKKGPERVLNVLMRLSQDVATMEPHRRLLERNPEKVLRMITSKSAPIQGKAIALIQGLLEDESQRGRLQLPFDAHTMAYILVRICESFLYADYIADEAVDFAKEELALKALLGIGGARAVPVGNVKPKIRSVRPTTNKRAKRVRGSSRK